MFGLCCPVCGELLKKSDKAYKCKNNHSFDIARQGYVNLLQSGKSKNKRRGDDKLMIEARRDFLNNGYYEPLLKEICSFAEKYTPENPCIIDCGCGDCYYTSKVFDTLKHKNPKIIAVDISKDALIWASKRSRDLTYAAASAFSLPVDDCSCDLLMNVFSPLAPKEYVRVLKRDGCMLRVTPLENHLFELKEVIYSKPYKNPPDNLNIEGLRLVESKNLRYKSEIKSNEDIKNLFKMTPYYYKTSHDDQCKLESVDSLKVSLEFCISAYKPL